MSRVPDLQIVTVSDTKVAEQGWDADYHARDLVTGFYRTLMHNWSNAYFHYRNGTFDKVLWMANVRDVENSAREKFVRDFWTQWRYVYDDDFAAFVDDTFSKVDEDPSSCGAHFGSCRGVNGDVSVGLSL